VDLWKTSRAKTRKLQRASLAWLPEEFKNRAQHSKNRPLRTSREHEFFRGGDVVQLGSGQPLMVVNAEADGERQTSPTSARANASSLRRKRNEA
jgi:hypothetical protein